MPTKWRPVIEKANTNDFRSILALPVSWWPAFPVYLLNNKCVI